MKPGSGTITVKSGGGQWVGYLIPVLLLALGTMFLVDVVFEITPMDDKDGRLWIIAILVAWDLVFIYVMYSTLLIPIIIQVDSETSFLLKSPLRTLSIQLRLVKKVQRDSDRDWEIWYEGGKSSLQFFRETDLNPFFDWLVSKKGINVYPR